MLLEYLRDQCPSWSLNFSFYRYFGTHTVSSLTGNTGFTIQLDKSLDFHHDSLLFFSFANSYKIPAF